jgi:NAD(P)-dependent dehydrogenase (short-subunit alcohol dehydrogenase family)
MSASLSGVALVTGGSSGIGLAVARALAAERMSLCLTGRDLVRLESAAEEIRSIGTPAWLYRADLESDTDLRGLADWVGTEVARLDVLVHSAGSIHLGNIESAGWEDLDAEYRTNLRAPFLLTKALLPLLKESGGQVVFVNSTAGLAAGADNGLYAAVKSGLRSLAGSIRDHVNGYGVRVLSVFPGRTATPMQDGGPVREETLPSRGAAPAERGRRDDRRGAHAPSDCRGDGRRGKTHEEAICCEVTR